MRYPSSFRYALLILLTLLFSGAGSAGCALDPEESATAALHRRFPSQAARVLQGSGELAAFENGFSVATGDDAAGGLERRGGLHLTLPVSGEDEVRFHLPGAFEVRVREQDLAGPGAVAERAVAYARPGGTSYWSVTEEGYEEWLSLDAVAATGGPVAAWAVDGAGIRQAGDAVEILDSSGATRMRVTAPAAYAAGGRKIEAKLSVNGSRIELSIDGEDARGEALLIDPRWVAAGSLYIGREDHSATKLANGKVLVAGGYAGWHTTAAELYDPATNTWSSAGTMANGRVGHTATLLSNGKVLIAGGYDGLYLASCELYNPATNTWSAAASLNFARSGATGTLLGNDLVLVAGGGYWDGYHSSITYASAELYDWTTDTWTLTTGSMATDRLDHTATLLSDGKVLVTGGGQDTPGAIVPLATSELYDPATQLWTATTGSLTTARWGHKATLLGNGNVLIAGGYSNSPSPTYMASAERYDFAAKTWSSAGTMSTGRVSHTATLLYSGKVLVTGGYNNGTYLATADLYDPTSNSWSTTVSMGATKAHQSATLLDNGQVLVAGGFNSTPLYLTDSELYEPLSDTWLAGATLRQTREWHTATRMADGRVLIAGGIDQFGTVLQKTVIYNPTSDTWTPSAQMLVARSRHMAILLGNGEVLVVGGEGSSSDLTSAELYDPATDTWTMAPSMATGHSHGTATLLGSGKVLVVGSYYGASTGADVYDPALNTWTATGAMGSVRSDHMATLLGNGKVLAAGGLSGCCYLASSELYDPATNSWTATSVPMGSQRRFARSILLNNGKVLVIGGRSTSTELATTETYDPTLDTWSPAGSMAQARRQHTATLLLDGRILVAGGYASGVLSSAELYDQGTNTWSAASALSAVRVAHTATLLANGRVLVHGGENGSVAVGTTEVYVP